MIGFYFFLSAHVLSRFLMWKCFCCERKKGFYISRSFQRYLKPHIVFYRVLLHFPSAQFTATSWRGTILMVSQFKYTAVKGHGFFPGALWATSTSRGGDVRERACGGFRGLAPNLEIRELTRKGCVFAETTGLLIFSGDVALLSSTQHTLIKHAPRARGYSGIKSLLALLELSCQQDR